MAKRTIPEIREAVREITARLRLQGDLGSGYLLDLADIDALMDETKRRPPVRRAEVEAPPITPEFAEKIRTFARDNPSLSYTKIARNFGLINTGRVSEVLAGKRGG